MVVRRKVGPIILFDAGTSRASFLILPSFFFHSEMILPYCHQYINSSSNWRRRTRAPHWRIAFPDLQRSDHMKRALITGQDGSFHFYAANGVLFNHAESNAKLAMRA